MTPAELQALLRSRAEETPFDHQFVDVRKDELLALLDEIERLRENEAARLRPFKEGDVVVTTAASTLDHFIGQRDEARAQLRKEQLDHISTIGQMSEQLAAMTAARDTLAEIAEAATFAIDNVACIRCRNCLDNIDTEQIDALRKVGAP